MAISYEIQFVTHVYVHERGFVETLQKLRGSNRIVLQIHVVCQDDFCEEIESEQTSQSNCSICMVYWYDYNIIF